MITSIVTEPCENFPSWGQSGTTGKAAQYCQDQKAPAYAMRDYFKHRTGNRACRGGKLI